MERQRRCGGVIRTRGEGGLFRNARKAGKSTPCNAGPSGGMVVRGTRGERGESARGENERGTRGRAETATWREGVAGGTGVERWG